MGEGKTVPGVMEAAAFIDAVEPPDRREEARVLDALFRSATGQPPVMWGPTIIGYGQYSTVYDSGRAVTNLRVGFSPRKPKLSLYLMGSGEGEQPPYAPLLARLGRHSQARACLYVNRLSAIDMGVLGELVTLAWQRSLAQRPD